MTNTENRSKRTNLIFALCGFLTCSLTVCFLDPAASAWTGYNSEAWFFDLDKSVDGLTVALSLLAVVAIFVGVTTRYLSVISFSWLATFVLGCMFFGFNGAISSAGCGLGDSCYSLAQTQSADWLSYFACMAVGLGVSAFSIARRTEHDDAVRPWRLRAKSDDH